MSDIIVNIAPAVFRIFIGVMNTLGKHQVDKILFITIKNLLSIYLVK